MNKVTNIAAIAGALTMIAAPSFASDNSDMKEIYNSLDVTEVDMRRAPAGSTVKTKKIGGLECKVGKVTKTPSRALYECNLDRSSADNRAIFNALDTRESIERTLTSNAGGTYVPAMVVTKSAGDLHCYKIKTMEADASVEGYGCTLRPD
jgi:hypothetical protein